MAVNYMASVPRLRGRENYADWAFAVENFLVLDGLENCITGAETDTGKDSKARAKLVLTIDSSLYVHIKESKTTKNLWENLKTLFDDSGFSRKIMLLRKLISTRLENCDSMVSYVNQIVETAQKLKGTGFDISEEWIGSLLLAGLPNKFYPMIMAIEHSGIQITTDAIKTKLMDMETETNGKNGAALVGNVDRGIYHNHNQYQNYNKKNKSYVGHNDGNIKVKKDIRCYKCKEIGHFKSNCPNKGEKSKTSSVFSAAFINGEFDKHDWYVDSGASVHLTANKDWLENVSEDTKEQNVMIANKTRITVNCVGNVNLNTVVNKQKYSITIKNALYVPELATNLLSVSELIKNENTVIFEENCCKIYNKEKVLVATADLINKVYRLNVDNSDKCLLASATTVSEEIWHRRLGHINYETLAKMKNGVVNGIVYKETGNKVNKNCTVCCEGKQSRLSFQRKGTRATTLLETIHADVCGPMETTSVGNSRYFVLFEDDYSRMVFVYFLKTKDEVIDRFKEFKNIAENQTNCKIKNFRSDNGGEFCNEAFRKFLLENGIVHQTTTPYTPEQNGMLERMNRTVVEKARCLLFDANLEKKFWAEAVNSAVYLRNRSNAAGLRDKTPFEVWTGKKPNVNHLRIFGSTAMVHIPKPKRTKWDKKATKMILVGFNENTKGYRLYNPENNSVIISRDVIIMENFEKEKEVVVSLDLNNKENANGLLDPVGDTKTNLHNIDDIFYDDTSNTDNESSDADYNGRCEMPEFIRRSERRRKPKNMEDYVTYICAEEISLEDVPETVSQALSRPDAQKWKEAMMDEMESFKENDAWELVDPPKKATIVDSKWIYKVKCNSKNETNYRARLVARGFAQKEGIDYSETFSPVVRHSTLRLLIALATKLDLSITHLDIKTAFLNGYLEENVYMRQPQGFIVKGAENKVCKLKRAIYGLKQSSRAWNKRVDDVLTKLNYKRSNLEPCLYIKRQNNLLTVVALYVDDFFIFSNDVNNTNMLKEYLNAQFKVKDLGEARQSLGVRIVRDYDKGCITLDQETYIDQILKKFNMSECKSVDTPMDKNVCLENSNNTCNENIPYQRLIGSLMYLAVLTRPDIAYAVSFLSQFNNCYSEIHWNCAKRILRYLKGTKSYVLKFTKDNCELEGYADADWASNVNDRKSYTGFIFKLSGAAVAWESCKQRTVALSSTEAEYMALSEASKEAIYLRNLLSELLDKECCVTIFNDNQSAQKLALNPIFHKRSKHIDVRYHFVRETVSNKLIDVKYIPTTDMTADILTKALPKIKHSMFLENLGIVDFLK